VTNKKVVLDTNAVLRFITDDNKEKSKKVSDLLSSSDCIVTIEVIVEVIYNLEKFYFHSRQLISEEIKDFIDIKQNLVFEEGVVRFGCNTYSATKFDFIDCLLVGYANIKGSLVFTFDDVLKKKLEHMAYV
jgi:predicted nucleic-acid-binding protein